MSAPSVSFDVVELVPSEGVNVVVGQAHFIKTIDDLHETLVPGEPAPALRHRVLGGVPAPGSSARQDVT